MISTEDRVNRLVTLFTQRRIASLERFTGGLSNSSYKVTLESNDEPIVLRIYDRDRGACRREVDLFRRLCPRVPVPEIIYAEPEGLDDGVPFALLKYVPGITFRQLKSTRDNRAIEQASSAVGGALAAIGQQTCEIPTEMTQVDTIPEVIRAYLASPSFVERAGKDLAGRVHALVSGWAPRLTDVARDRRLIHGDFRKQNVLVHQVAGEWGVAAILDWECAGPGSPLNDVGVFLRYEHSSDSSVLSAFARGFVAGGGRLDDDWIDLVRVVDLKSLCRILAGKDLPSDVAGEVVDLVAATVRDVSRHNRPLPLRKDSIDLREQVGRRHRFEE